MFFGCGMAWTSLKFFEATFRHPGLTRWSRYSTLVWRNNHFRSFNVSPPSFSNVRTSLRWVICSSIVFEKTMISSKYTIANFHRTELITISICVETCLGRWYVKMTCGKIWKGHDAKQMRSFRGPARISRSASDLSCSLGYWRFSLRITCRYTHPCAGWGRIL